MLVHLHVKNLALIDEIEVEFGPGLNILTGEIGAGKDVYKRQWYNRGVCTEYKSQQLRRRYRL